MGPLAATQEEPPSYIPVRESLHLEMAVHSPLIQRSRQRNAWQMVDALVLNPVVVEEANRHLEGLKLAKPDHSQEARNARPDLL